MKKHKFQWLIGGLIILVALAIGVAAYNTYSPKKSSSVSESIIEERYQTWKKEYLRGNQQQQFVKTNTAVKDQTLSEAQGYGMLIAVMAAKQGFGSQKTFNQLTRYYIRHRISSKNPLMAWRQHETGIAMKCKGPEKTSATDGDLDIAYALILADEKWGSDGELNYNQLAKKLLSAIQKQEINPKTHLPMVGNWAAGGHSSELVRTSDLMVTHFRKFASYTQDVSWTKVANNSQDILKKLSNQSKTGLMADFVSVSGTDLKIEKVKSKQIASKYDNQYGFNACRIPWRVAYDYQLTNNQDSKKIVQKICSFFAKKKQITAVYTLNGKAVEDYTNLAFTAPIAYAAQVVGNDDLTDRYVEILTDWIEPKNYYPATIQMVTLLASGEIGK